MPRVRRRRADLPGRARACSTSGTPATSRGRSPTRWPTSTRWWRCRSRRASRPSTCSRSATPTRSRSTVLTSDLGPVLLVDGDVALCVTGPSYAAGSMLDAVLPLLRSRSVDDVDAALERWVEPVNNVLIADRSGRTLHRVAGQMSGAAAADRGRAGRRAGHGQRPGQRRLRRARGPLRPALPGLAIADARWLLDRLDGRGCGGRARRRPPRPRSPAGADRDPVRRGALGPGPRQPRCTSSPGTGGLVATSADAALYVLRPRPAGPRHRRGPSRCAELADASAYGEMWVPWLWLPGRIATTLAGWLDAERPLGIDIDALLVEALDVAAGDATVGRAAPVCADARADATSASTHDFDPVVAGTGLDGDSDCVAATRLDPGPSAQRRRAGRPLRLGPRRPRAQPLGGAARRRDQRPTRDQFDAWSSCRLIPSRRPA